MGKRKAVEAL